MAVLTAVPMAAMTVAAPMVGAWAAGVEHTVTMVANMAATMEQVMELCGSPPHMRNTT